MGTTIILAFVLTCTYLRRLSWAFVGGTIRELQRAVPRLAIHHLGSPRLESPLEGPKAGASLGAPSNVSYKRNGTEEGFCVPCTQRNTKQAA